jgi:S1-C subfamily serine protease
VSGQAVRSTEGFRAAVDGARTGEALALLVERAGTRAFVPLRIP